MKRRSFLTRWTKVATSATLPLLMLVAMSAILSARGAVYDATTGYVTLLRNGTTSVIPMNTNHVAEVSGTTTNYLWSDHLALHAGTNYYAGTWSRS